MSPFLDESGFEDVRTVPQDYKRLFVCLETPAYLQRSLAALREDIVGARWTEPQHLHLTLRFIGEVDPFLEERVVNELSRIHVKPFMLPIRDIGCYEVRGEPRTLWAGLGGGHPHLFQLQRKIEDALVGLGLPMAARRFHPHITLARLKGVSSQTVSRFRKRHRGFEGPPIKVRSFALYSSHLDPTGPTYQTEQAWALAA